LQRGLIGLWDELGFNQRPASIPMAEHVVKLRLDAIELRAIGSSPLLRSAPRMSEASTSNVSVSRSRVAPARYGAARFPILIGAQGDADRVLGIVLRPPPFLA
jgi:hypothetical protein